MPKLIVGCGYLGLRVAKLWREAGETVHVLTRSADKARELAREGISATIASSWVSGELDMQLSQDASFPQVIDSLLFSVGYERQAAAQASTQLAAQVSPLPIQAVYSGGLKTILSSAVLNQRAAPMCRLIYISSTGVYGSAAGDFVDEETPPQPAREGGKASLAAEEVLRSSPFAGRGLVLRLAGIYGPGRIPRAESLRAGQPIDAPAEGWLNLIHVEDAARIVVLAGQRAALPNLYCVCDGAAVQRGDYYRELARLLSAPEPRFLAPDPNSSAALRAGSDKRVSPAKLFRDLAPQLLYPSYREGLANILAGD